MFNTVAKYFLSLFAKGEKLVNENISNSSHE